MKITKGLEDADHGNDVVDLYRMCFDPVFRMADFASYAHDSIPGEILEEMNLRERVLEQVIPSCTMKKSW